MVIRTSSAKDVASLVADLREGDAARREAAIARLRVIGSRADERLAELIASTAPTAGRVAALRALEGRDEARARQVARLACHDQDPLVATAAIAVLRGFVAHERGIDLLDTLSGIALDAGRDATVRLAALDALSELPVDLVRPLVQGVRGSLTGEPASAPTGEALNEPLAMQEWIAGHPRAPLSALHEAIVRAREQETEAAAGAMRQAWRSARGAAHAALAGRGSRVALYDLRETFDAAIAALPLDFVIAMDTLGDASCLEPLARAWTAAPHDARWRDRLRETALGIARRGKLTARHAHLKRVRARYPGFV